VARQTKAIRCDNGPEYISHALAAWAKKHGIALMFIQPGNPQQNACVERSNRTVNLSGTSNTPLKNEPTYKTH